MLYVVVKQKERIGEFMRRERNTLPVTDPAPIGTLVAIKTAHNRKPTCLLEVTACTPDPEGHTLTVRIAPFEHVPKLLHADSSRGYTSDPRLALFGEPEAIDQDVLDGTWAMRAGRRYEKARVEKVEREREQRRQLAVEERMIRVKQAARTNHVDVSSELDLVRKHIRAGRSEASVTQRIEAAERAAYKEAA